MCTRYKQIHACSEIFPTSDLIACSVCRKLMEGIFFLPDYKQSTTGGRNKLRMKEEIILSFSSISAG